jgi:oligopeptidase A
LSHDDVITLFHEFGHGLHLMLTQVNERDVGMGGVEWDAIELPSQFMENFCWQWSVLKPMTAHVDTGEPMPEALFDKMLAAKNYQTGLQTLRQIEFGLYDMGMHVDATKAQDLLAHARAVRAEVGVLSPPAYLRDNSFNHLFGQGGGYAAGYYSYKWAEVLSADAYAAFEETALPDGSANPATGQRYCEQILAVGSSRPAMDSFKAFRGREPSIDALLRHQGMATA